MDGPACVALVTGDGVPLGSDMGASPPAALDGWGGDTDPFLEPRTGVNGVNSVNRVTSADPSGPG
jgi:hypothetical protein